MRNFLIKNEKKVLRILEILPGFFSWNVILFPYWGIFIFPEAVAYFILFYNIYWFYQSFTIAISSTISHWRIQASMIYKWEEDIKSFPDYKHVHHAVVIVNYNEPLHILERTIQSLADQTLDTKQISVVLAMEEKEPKESRIPKAKKLKKKFANKFDNFFVTVHKLLPNEIAGKASNERYAAIKAKEKLLKQGKKYKYITITSCDADHKYHPNHFAELTFKFLDNPKRHNTFWQPAIMFYNNIWDLPALTRIPNTFGSIWNLSQLPRKDRLINQQNYTLSLKLLEEAGYWDPDKIPEDWGIFFKAYYVKKGKVEVEPIYLPVTVDAALSSNIWSTFKNQYEQYKRWAWGVSDDSWIIYKYLTIKNVPFWDKTMRLFYVLWAHFMWPVNWFIITIGLTIPSLINPRFARTTLGHTIPKFSSMVLTLALVFLVIMIIFDNIYKPKRPKNFPLWRSLIIPLEFILMPIAGFIFNALPGLDAHTRLMLGKYIEYRVTEKV